MIGGLITASGNGWQQFINGTNIGGPVLQVGQQAPQQIKQKQKGGKQTRLKSKSKKNKFKTRKSKNKKYKTK